MGSFDDKRLPIHLPRTDVFEGFIADIGPTRLELGFNAPSLVWRRSAWKGSVYDYCNVFLFIDLFDSSKYMLTLRRKHGHLRSPGFGMRCWSAHIHHTAAVDT